MTTDVLTPQMFDPNAGTPGYNSTAAIAAAIAACPPGGAVRIPATPSGYTISGGFTITTPISIFGDGFGSQFVGTLPANVDLFHVVGPANATLRGIFFDRMAINLNGGGNWFHFDTSASNANLAEVEVTRIRSFAVPGGHAIYIDNVASNPNGGTFDANFEKNLLTNAAPHACICISNGGDSIRIRDGILTGSGYAVLASQIGGAGNLLIEGCNITAAGGISISRAVKPIIRDFEMEFAGPLYTGAGININGADGLVDGATIGPGQVQALSTASNFGETVYVDNAQNVGIDGLRLASGVGGVGISLSARCQAARIGLATSFIGFAANIVDSGIGTIYTAAK